MGFVVLHMEKAHGSDSGTTAHIERFIIPKNADPTRTHLNRKLVAYPDGIKDRSAAIQRRLEEAGLTRKSETTKYGQSESTCRERTRTWNASKGRAFGRVVRRQYEILRRHVRKGEHRGGAPASGRGKRRTYTSRSSPSSRESVNVANGRNRRRSDTARNRPTP